MAKRNDDIYAGGDGNEREEHPRMDSREDPTGADYARSRVDYHQKRNDELRERAKAEIEKHQEAFDGLAKGYGPK